MKSVIICILLLSLIAVLKAQTSVVVSGSGTFVGQDNSTPCKYCPIPCGDLPFFTGCTSPVYKYGCDIMSPCITLKTASRTELRSGFLLCMIYNGCKINYSPSSPYVIKAGQESKLIDAYMDKLFYQNIDKRFLVAMTSLFDGNTKELDNNKLQGTVAINLLEEMDSRYNVRQLIQMLGFMNVDKMMTFKFTQDVRDALAKKQTFKMLDASLNVKIRSLPASIIKDWGVSPVSQGLFNQVANTSATNTEKFLLFSSKLGITLGNIVTNYNALLVKAQSVADYDQLVQYRYDYYKNIEAIQRTFRPLLQNGVYNEVSPSAIYPRYDHTMFINLFTSGLTKGYAFFDSKGNFFKDNVTQQATNTLNVSPLELNNMLYCFNQGIQCTIPLALGNEPYIQLNMKASEGKFWVLVAVKQADTRTPQGRKNHFMVQKTFTGYILVTWIGPDFLYENIHTIEYVRMTFMA